MSEKPLIRQGKPTLSLGDLCARLPADAAQWAALLCIALFIAAPFVVGVLSLFYLNIDKTVLAHARIIQHCVWPLSALAGFAAIEITLLRGRYQWKHLLSWLRANPVYLCFGVLVLWMLISTCVNGWDYICLYGDHEHFRYETIYTQLGNFLILFPAGLLLRDEEKKRTLARLHEAVSLFLAIVALILWNVDVDVVFVYNWGHRVTSIFTNSNYYGYYLAVTVPLSAALFVLETRPGWKTFSAIALAVNAGVLSLNNTMGAWVACTAAMIFLMIARGVLTHRFDWQVLAATAIFAVCLYLPGHLLGTFDRNLAELGTDIFNIATGSKDADHAGSWRWIIWKRGLELISGSPVFGIGFDGVVARGLIQFARHARIHNEFLQYAEFYGVPAGIAYIAGCLGVFIRAVRRRAHLDSITLACLTGAFGYLVSSFFGLTLFSTAPFLFIFLGMGYVRR